jgi:uncharacterized protein
MTDYQLLHTTIIKSLGSLMRILEKGELHAKDNGLADEVLLNARLAPDMFPFVSQVRIATDDARRNLYLLAGKEHVKMEDNESTFVELKARIVKTQELAATLTDKDFEGADERHVSLYWMGGAYILGKDFVQEFAIQNTLFHIITAYDILRNQGVNIGKMDFIGPMSIHQSQSTS